MQHTGKISEWNDSKGYGFVVSSSGGPRAFVHITAFGRTTLRPSIGDAVSYETLKDDKGRFNAVNIRYVGKKTNRSEVFSRSLARAIIGASVLGVLFIAWRNGLAPTSVATWCGVMSCCAFVLYGRDKYEAVTDQRRTKESTLHLFDLLGGWPGALVAQGIFRHKSTKASFQSVFITTVLLNSIGIAWLLSDGNFAIFKKVILSAIAGG